jgi:hypothetical protein
LAAVTPTTFRAALYTRMKATAGIEFTDAQIDEAGRAAFNAAFPALYNRLKASDVVPTYNSKTGYSSISLTGLTTTSRVYRIEEQDWEYDIRGWVTDGFETISRIPLQPEKVVVYYIAPFIYPVSSITIPDEWPDALYTYAELTLVEMLLNDYAQFRGYKPNSREGAVDEASLQNMHTNLFNKWTRERDERAMGMPVGIA